MDKVVNKIAALRPGEHYHSLEFFPPKTAMVYIGLPHLDAVG
jgi:methylenetetrahydrofolate reductase (NADPH)